MHYNIVHVQRSVFSETIKHFEWSINVFNALCYQTKRGIDTTVTQPESL